VRTWIAIALLIATAVAAPRAVAGATLLDEKVSFGPEPASDRRELEVSVPAGVTSLRYDTAFDLKEGVVGVTMLAPDGATLRSWSAGEQATVGGELTGLPEAGGKLLIRLEPEAAVGTVRIRVERPSSDQGLLFMLGALGMMFLGIAVAVVYGVSTRVGWRWLWIGAAVWAVGVALKFGFAIPLNGPIMGALEAALPHGAYLAAGSLYIGLLTGVFEIGVTLAAALLWKGMTRTPARAVAVGLGAGSIEAFLLGLATALGLLAVLFGDTEAAKETADLEAVARTTPLAFLVGPVERILAILCHSSSRALVLLGVATRRWRLVLFGFLLLTGLDAVAGLADESLAGWVVTWNVWWIELTFVPFAVASVPVLLWCWKQWPRPLVGADSPS